MKKGKTVYTFLMLIFVIGCCPPAAYYTVVFNSNNGTGDIATQTFLISVDQALDLNTFTRIGYTFTEWNTGANGSGNSYADGEIVNNLAIANSSVVILYAQWKPVIDNSSGGNNGNGNNTNNDSGGNGNGGNNNNPSGATYYTVKFDSDGGSTIAKQTVQYEETVNMPSEPVKEGYTFDGWYYNGSEFDFNTPIKNNIVLIAHWSTSGNNNNPTTYTVTFDSDGGSTVDTQTVEHGKTATTPTEPTKDGYTFDGWYYNGNKFDFSTQIKSNITLTAHWSASNNNDDDNIGNGSVTVTTPQYNDIKLTIAQNDTSVTLIADTGYTDYTWLLDGKVLTGAGNSSLTLDTTDWLKGAYEMTVEAQKGSNWYSATVYITIGGN